MSTAIRGDIHASSFLESFSHKTSPSIANTFLFGFRPTGSRFATLLTKNARLYSTHGCVI
jgi:hypothetical protein